jgi:hypothetical protein
VVLSIQVSNKRKLYASPDSYIATVFGEEYKSRSLSLCNFLQPAVTS